MKQPHALLVIVIIAAGSWGCAHDAAGPKRLSPFSLARAGLPASATGPTFTTIDFPGGFATLAADINKTGQIVGSLPSCPSRVLGAPTANVQLGAERCLHEALTQES